MGNQPNTNLVRSGRVVTVYAGRRVMPGLTPGSDLPSRPEGAGSPWPAKPGC